MLKKSLFLCPRDGSPSTGGGSVLISSILGAFPYLPPSLPGREEMRVTPLSWSKYPQAFPDTLLLCFHLWVRFPPVQLPSASREPSFLPSLSSHPPNLGAQGYSTRRPPPRVTLQLPPCWHRLGSSRQSPSVPSSSPPSLYSL